MTLDEEKAKTEKPWAYNFLQIENTDYLIAVKDKDSENEFMDKFKIYDQQVIDFLTGKNPSAYKCGYWLSGWNMP